MFQVCPPFKSDKAFLVFQTWIASILLSTGLSDDLLWIEANYKKERVGAFCDDGIGIFDRSNYEPCTIDFENENMLKFILILAKCVAVTSTSIIYFSSFLKVKISKNTRLKLFPWQESFQARWNNLLLLPVIWCLPSSNPLFKRTCLHLHVSQE